MANVTIPKVTDNRLTLADFNNDQSQQLYSLNDFKDDPDEAAPVGNRASNVNAAAYSASMNFDPSDIIDSYNRAINEATTYGQSATMSKLVSDQQHAISGAYKDDMFHVLADPSLNDGQKKTYVNNVLSANSKLYDPPHMVAVAALAAPVADETEEQANHRVNISSISLRLAQNKEEMQQIYNAHVNTNNPEFVGKVADFAANFLLPFGKSVAASRIRADQDGSAAMAFVKTMFASGQSQKVMRERLENLPLEEQPAAARALADIISTHSGITPFTQNNVTKMELLKSMIDPTGYTDGDAWRDNIGGVFDLAMGALQGASAGVSVAKATSGVADVGRALKASTVLSEAKPGDSLLNFEKEFKVNFESPASRFAGTNNTQPFGKPIDVDSEMFKRGLKEKLAEWVTSKPDATGLEKDISEAIDATKKARRSSQEVDVATAIKKWEKEKPTVDSFEADLQKSLDSFNKKKAKGKPTTVEENLAADIAASGKKADDTSDFEKEMAAAVDKWTAEQKAASNVARDLSVSEVQPASLSQVFKDTNADKARAIHQMNAAVGNDSVAEAAYGTSRADAISHDIMPQAGHVDGSVGSRVPKIDRVAETEKALSTDVKEMLENDGKIQFSDLEKAGTRAWAEKKFRAAFGSDSRPEMSQVFPNMDFQETPSGFMFRHVFGPNTSNPEEALAVAKYTARNTGIEDKSLTLMVRDGDKYVPTTLEKELAKPQTNALGEPAGDYLVSIDHKFVMDSADVRNADAFQNLTVKYNFFDRHHLTDGSEGTLNMAVIDPMSMFDPVVTLAALHGVDAESGLQKALLTEVKDFVKGFRALKRDRQNLILNEIQEANLRRRDYDFVRLSASGATEAEQKLLRDFKRFQDEMWHLDNAHAARSLRNQGFMEHVDTATNSTEPVRKVARGTVHGNVNVYDHATDKLVKMTAQEVKELEARGGGLARVRTKFKDSNGDVVEYFKYDDTAKGSYLREISNSSQVLRYLPGYYKIQYKSSHFIIETLKDSRGHEVYSKAIEVAKDIPSAKLIVNRMQANADEGLTYTFRAAKEDTAADKVAHDTDVLLGRGNYRRRGKLLEDSDTPQESLGKTYIRSPVESMVNAIRRVAKHTSMEDIIDSQTNRIIKQYGHLLPKDEFGRPLIPRDLRAIVNNGKSKFNPKEVGDAASSVAYANFLRHGYKNHLDDGFKAMFKVLADSLGDAGLGKAERVARGISRVSPTGVGKGAAFTALLALNPLRQFIVQSSQIAMLVSVNPRWLVTKSLGQLQYLALRQAGIHSGVYLENLGKAAGLSVEQGNALWKEFKLSGLSAGIDRQNMVAGAVNDSMGRMVQSVQGTATSAVTAPFRGVVNISRTLGFDAGEFTSTAGSWLAFRDLAVRAGHDVSRPDIANTIAAKARNYTGGMNRAGDLPQNENSLAAVFQFTQNMQKMVLGASTNRINSLPTKLAMGTSAVVLYGLPTAVVFGGLLDSVPPEWKDRLNQGLESWTLNKMMQVVTGEDPRLDWSGFNPFNVYGNLDLIHTIFTTDIGQVIAGIPSVSLIAGNNPRLANAFRSFAQYTNLIPDYPDHPHTAMQVAADFCKISSGCSNLFKAKLALQTNKIMSSSGNVTDQYVSNFAAAAKLAGIPTLDESYRMDINNRDYAKSSAMRKDVAEHYKQWKAFYSDPNVSPDQLHFADSMNQMFWKTYGTDYPEARRMFVKMITDDFDRGEKGAFGTALRNSYLYDEKGAMSRLDETPFEKPEDKETVRKILIYGNNFTDTRSKGK